MKRKSRTSCQPIALYAIQCWVIERNHSRTCEDRPYCRRWSWQFRRGEGRWKGFSCVGIFVMRWSSTKNHRSLLDFSGVGPGEEQEKNSRYYPKKVDWAAKKLILDRREKLSLGCCAIGHERKQNTHKKKEQKERRRKMAPSSIRRARGSPRRSPIEKTYRKLHGKSSLYRKTR